MNAISPVAATRIFRTEVKPECFAAESVAAAVTFPASKSSQLSRYVLHAADGLFGLGQFQTLTEVDRGQSTTPEAVCDALG